MTTNFPTNTVVVIIAAMIGVAAGLWLSLSQALKQLSLAQHIGRVWRWSVAIVLVAWLLVRLALAVNPPSGEVISTPIIVSFLVAGLLAGILPLLISPTFRQVIRAVPETWLVGIHAIRVFGFLFLALLDMRLLPPEFALPAGYGDIVVGLLALGMVYLLMNRKPYARVLVIGWNVLGLLDFVIALTAGVIYIGPFATQVAALGVSPLYLNYVLIVPTFGVPLFALLHLYSLFQIASPRADTHEQEAKAWGQTPPSPENRPVST